MLPHSAVGVDTHDVVWRTQQDVGSSRYRVASMSAWGRLTYQQTNFFDTLRFIESPAPLRDDIERINARLKGLSQPESARFETFERSSVKSAI
jgi:hypothetical protein